MDRWPKKLIGKNGVKDGAWKKYYDNGTMMMYTAFSQDKRSGAFIFNYPDGNQNGMVSTKTTRWKANGYNSFQMGILKQPLSTKTALLQTKKN
jgi:hypothetical protein